MFAQVRVNAHPQPVALPRSEVMINRPPRSKVAGHIAPLAAGLDPVEDGVEQLPKRMFAGATLLAGFAGFVPAATVRFSAVVWQ